MSIFDGPIVQWPTQKAYPIERVGAQAWIPSWERAVGEMTLWQLQRAIGEAKFSMLKSMIGKGMQPLPGWDQFELIARFEARAISDEIPHNKLPMLPDSLRELTVIRWDGR